MNIEAAREFGPRGAHDVSPAEQTLSTGDMLARVYDELRARLSFHDRMVDEGRALILEALALRRDLFGPEHLSTHPDDDLPFFVSTYLPDEPEARALRAQSRAEQEEHARRAAAADAQPRVSVVRGEVLVEDHFDGTELDDRWRAHLDGAEGWARMHEGGRLVATEIRPVKVHKDGSGSSARVIIQRALPPLGDFHVRARVGWDDAELRAMRRVGIEVFGSGRLIAQAYAADDGAYACGTTVAYVNGLARIGKEIPPSGTAVIELERLAGRTRVLWNGEELMSGLSSDAATGVQVVFSFYALKNRDCESVFAPVWIDDPRLVGSPYAQYGSLSPRTGG